MIPDGTKRIAGAFALDEHQKLEAYAAENVIFAVGGPGGLYQNQRLSLSAYRSNWFSLDGRRKSPKPAGIPVWYGFHQISVECFGYLHAGYSAFYQYCSRWRSDPVEFMRPYFKSVGEMNSMVFLKGYQWPFDWRKVRGGSSIVDILVYIETVLKGRRVFLDFRTNPQDFDFNALSEEALTYLTRSEALLESPIARLEKMNPGAITLYLDHGIDIRTEPLEIAVCAQHNNGGLAGNAWWESLNVKHLFVLGEVNGSHGVYRPGGAALNSGQVGGFRAAEYIANRYQDYCDSEDQVQNKLSPNAIANLCMDQQSESTHNPSWQEERAEFQNRMSRAGAHIRSLDALRSAVPEAWAQWQRLQKSGDPANIRRKPPQPAALFCPCCLSGSPFIQPGARYRKPGSSIASGSTGQPYSMKVWMLCGVSWMKIRPSAKIFWKQQLTAMDQSTTGGSIAVHSPTRIPGSRQPGHGIATAISTMIEAHNQEVPDANSCYRWMGEIGQPTVQSLLATGHEVRVLDLADRMKALPGLTAVRQILWISMACTSIWKGLMRLSIWQLTGTQRWRPRLR